MGNDSVHSVTLGSFCHFTQSAITYIYTSQSLYSFIIYISDNLTQPFTTFEKCVLFRYIVSSAHTAIIPSNRLFMHTYLNIYIKIWTHFYAFWLNFSYWLARVIVIVVKLGLICMICLMYDILTKLLVYVLITFTGSQSFQMPNLFWYGSCFFP